MNLLDKLKTLVQSTVSDAARSAVQDLLGDDDARKNTPSRVPALDTEKLLKQADKRLAKLREDLADAVAREKRAEQSWQAAGANARKLNDEIDALIKADKTDDARAKLQQAKLAEKQVNDLERDAQRHEQLSAKLRQEMALLEEQLNAVRRKLNQPEVREANANVAEQTQQATHEQRKQAEKEVERETVREAEKIEPELKAKEEAVARPELDSSRMADVLKRLREQKEGK